MAKPDNSRPSAAAPAADAAAQAAPAPAPAAPSADDSGRFEGRREFHERLLWMLARAADEGWREMVWCDADYTDWPLGERAYAEALGHWSRSGRKIILIARRWDEAMRRHHRFVQWRQRWSHIIDARACPSADPLELPSLIWSPALVLQRLDPVRCVGLWSRDPARVLALRDGLDDWYGKSTPGFPASTLGL